MNLNKPPASIARLPAGNTIGFDRIPYAPVILIVIVIACDMVGMHAMAFSITISGKHVVELVIVGAAMLVLHLVSLSPRCAKVSATLRLHELCFASWMIWLFGLFSYAALVLQSLAVAVAAPLVDARLVAMDAALGFHWPTLAAWHASHPLTTRVLYYVYLSYAAQMVFAVLILSLVWRKDDIYEFFLLFASLTIVVIAVSALVPASNPFVHFGLVGKYQPSPWSQFYPLRDGTLRVIDLNNRQGLISIPSLHAVFAVLFTYAVRQVRYVFPAFAVLNAAMLYSALYAGAHYLVDIFAGLLIVAAAIALSRWWRRSQRQLT